MILANVRRPSLRRKESRNFGDTVGQASWSMVRHVRNRSRSASARFGERHFGGLDGVCELLDVLAGEPGPISLGIRGHAIALGMKERIRGLRRRANTAPARMETVV